MLGALLESMLDRLSDIISSVEVVSLADSIRVSQGPSQESQVPYELSQGPSKVSQGSSEVSQDPYLLSQGPSNVSQTSHNDFEALQSTRVWVSAKTVHGTYMDSVKFQGLLDLHLDEVRSFAPTYWNPGKFIKTT